MQYLGTRILETSRLILRPFTPDDTDVLFNELTSDQEVTRYLSFKPHTRREESRQMVAEWIEAYTDNKTYHWCIALKTTGAVIGYIGVTNILADTDTAIVTYAIGKRYWNNGIASEAFKAVIYYMFEMVGVAAIQAMYDPRNMPSGRVMEKCGLHYNSIVINADYNNLGECDLVVYYLSNPQQHKPLSMAQPRAWDDLQ